MVINHPTLERRERWRRSAKWRRSIIHVSVSLGGHPGSYLKYDVKVLHIAIGTRGVSLSVAYHASTPSLGRRGLGNHVAKYWLLIG